ncbi:hypothetical protein K2X85_13820 [bacterium]|nr:hypothetical protein [bacterium]
MFAQLFKGPMGKLRHPIARFSQGLAGNHTDQTELKLGRRSQGVIQSVGVFGVAVLCLLMGQSSLFATVITLSDLGQNSSLQFDPASGQVTSWRVEGLEEIARQQFYFRVGSPSIGNPELAVNASNLALVSANSFNLNGVPGDDFLNSVYQGPLFRLTLASLVLTAGSLGSDQATFVESIRIDNTSSNPLTLSLFLYADYNLIGSAIDESAFFSDPRAVTQIKSLLSPASIVHEASVTVTPSFVQVGTGGAIAALLNDANGDNLNNLSSLSGAGDYEYAIQWNLTIAAGRSFTLGVTNSVTVPEAGSIVLIGLATGLLATWSIRRRVA